MGRLRINFLTGEVIRSTTLRVVTDYLNKELEERVKSKTVKHVASRLKAERELLEFIKENENHKDQKRLDLALHYIRCAIREIDYAIELYG